MSTTPTSPFSAGPSTLGYLHQCRLALLEFVRRKKVRMGTLAVRIEGLDDVSFEGDGSPLELLQSKHHLNRVANLTNSGTDLWKTLRVWASLIRAGQLEPTSAVLTLISTQNAAPGSVAAMLGPKPDRDVKKAQTTLERIARESGSEENSTAYFTFLQLDPAQRRSLLDATFICCGCHTAAEVGRALGAELWVYVEEPLRIRMLEVLEGWWFARIIRYLAHQETAAIDWSEVAIKLDDITSEYIVKDLPNEFGDLTPDTPLDPANDNRLFVRQLRAVDVSRMRILIAMRDHWRAGNQRASWLRNVRLLADDVTRYERKLMEEWSRLYHQMMEDLPQPASESALVTAGRKLFNVIDGKVVPLAGFTDAFYCRGAHHELANRPSIGWHPKWEAQFNGGPSLGSSDG